MKSPQNIPLGDDNAKQANQKMFKMLISETMNHMKSHTKFSDNIDINYEKRSLRRLLKTTCFFHLPLDARLQRKFFLMNKQRTQNITIILI